jgi:hypothetical protein
VAYEDAKQSLSQAQTFQERCLAIRAALVGGMPLAEIEQFLDDLDAARGGPPFPLPGRPPADQQPPLPPASDS